MDNFNFKEVAEKCLNGGLSGTIIIEDDWMNRYKVPSKNLILDECDPNRIYKYKIKTEGVKGAEGRTTYFASFSITGESELGHYRVVDFIPDNNMDLKERSVKLSLEKAKEWYRQGGEFKEVALQAFSEDELKIVDRPRSWEEYYNKHYYGGFYIASNSGIKYLSKGLLSPETDKNMLPTRSLAKKFLAYMQLMSLRKAWIGDWEPDWCDYNTKYCIYSRYRHTVVGRFQDSTKPLSFPTEEMAKDFLDCFKDLLDETEGLY